LQSLEKSKVRKYLGLTAIEGEKEIEMAMVAGIEFQTIFFLKELANNDLLIKIERKYPGAEFISLSKDLFTKISYRESTGGFLVVAKTLVKTLETLKLPKNPLILIIEAVEKPGNLGAILRTADAANVDAVVCCNLPSDVYNPNVIRSSLGTVFTVPLAIANNAETMAWLKQHKIVTYCTNLHKAKDYHLQNYTQGCAIVMGTEASGVSSEWINFANQNIKIPMLGKIDSINVSVATAIVVYEAKRQRGF